MVESRVSKHRIIRSRDAALLGLVMLGMSILYVIFADRSAAPQARASAPDASQGQQLYVQSCASCHGLSGQGMPRQGADLRNSRFVSRASDAALLAFLRSGRMQDDPARVMKLIMPPRGGNASLRDEHLSDIVAYLRTVQQEQRSAANAGN